MRVAVGLALSQCPLRELARELHVPLVDARPASALAAAHGCPGRGAPRSAWPSAASRRPARHLQLGEEEAAAMRATRRRPRPPARRRRSSSMRPRLLQLVGRHAAAARARCPRPSRRRNQVVALERCRLSHRCRRASGSPRSCARSAYALTPNPQPPRDVRRAQLPRPQERSSPSSCAACEHRADALPHQCLATAPRGRRRPPRRPGGSARRRSVDVALLLRHDVSALARSGPGGSIHAAASRQRAAASVGRRSATM